MTKQFYDSWIAAWQEKNLSLWEDADANAHANVDDDDDDDGDGGDDDDDDDEDEDEDDDDDDDDHDDCKCGATSGLGNMFETTSQKMYGSRLKPCHAYIDII